MDSRALSPEHHTAAEVVRLLQLEPLELEGGFFRRTAESEQALPGGRRTWSVIYFLFTPEAFSALHRLAADEIWCFHSGDPLESLRLKPGGGSEWVKLGLNLTAGERPQDIVRVHTWQGTRLVSGGRWALVSCLVVPGFVWEDFELGHREALTAMYPKQTAGIRRLTRTQPAAGA